MMFRELRRKDKRMNQEDVEKLLEKSEYGVMSCAGDGDYGYGVPVNYLYYNNAVYFHCAYEGHKIDGIKNNPKVSFLVIGENQVRAKELNTKFESVVVFGKAEIIEGEEKRKALVKIGERFSKDFEEIVVKEIDKLFNKTCVVKINIEHKEGKIAK
jgi:hypothetical protein